MTDWLRSLLQRKPRHYAGWLEGRDPMNIGALWQEMYRSEYFEGGRVLTAAISAIDIALYDIKGKALGLPVWQLLGGKHRDYVDTFASVRATETRRVIELTQQLLEAGWTCVRLPRAEGPAGNPSIFDPWQSLIVTAVSLAKVRETVGPGVILGIDYHHRLSVAEAASFCQRMPPGTLDWIEEPIRDEGPEAYESLRRMTPIPFALVEVPVGFKWFTKGLLDGTMGFAGEDSGGASFLRQDGTAWITDRDGLIVGLLAADLIGFQTDNDVANFAAAAGAGSRNTRARASCAACWTSRRCASPRKLSA